MPRHFRRSFLATSAAIAAAGVLPRLALAQAKEPLFKISLAQWSLNKAIKAGRLANRDFAKTAKEDFGIDAIEYVNQLWIDQGKEWMESARDKAYVGELKKRADDLGVKTLRSEEHTSELQSQSNLVCRLLLEKK